MRSFEVSCSPCCSGDQLVERLPHVCREAERIIGNRRLHRIEALAGLADLRHGHIQPSGDRLGSSHGRIGGVDARHQITPHRVDLGDDVSDRPNHNPEQMRQRVQRDEHDLVVVGDVDQASADEVGKLRGDLRTAQLDHRPFKDCRETVTV